MTELNAFYAEMEKFFQPLWPGEDKPLVFGEGNAMQPPLMLIGEAPGETEVIKRRPFVGKAGKNLDEFLTLMDMKREDIYISNVVKIRPTEQGPTGRLRNRAPSKEELALFTPWLMKEIAIVQPKVLVTLGNVPLKALTNPKITIGDCHGTLMESQAGIALYALYHPASIIYRRALLTVYQEDVLNLKERLAQNKLTIQAE